MIQFNKMLVAFSCTVSISCAGVATRQDKIDTTVAFQVDVLRKIVQLREQSEVKAKINADSVLSAQEYLLMSGLSSVIRSQEAYLRVQGKNENKRGENVKQ